MGWRIFSIVSRARAIKFTNISQPMLKLTTHYGFHDLFFNYIVKVLQGHFFTDMNIILFQTKYLLNYVLPDNISQHIILLFIGVQFNYTNYLMLILFFL